MTEIIQPHLEKPDFSDDMTWATICRVHTLWFREILPQLSIDVHKVIIGYSLTTVVGDDYGAIAFKQNIVNNPKVAEISKQMLLERMDWEVSIPELWPGIRGQIHQARLLIEPLDLSDKDQYDQARCIWIMLRNEIHRIINSDDTLIDAVKYHQDHVSTWSPYWQAFLADERI